jgi:hypothetical protein
MAGGKVADPSAAASYGSAFFQETVERPSLKTRTNLRLRTLDVRQIRRRALGKRKAPGMESNRRILHNPWYNG